MYVIDMFELENLTKFCYIKVAFIFWKTPKLLVLIPCERSIF